MKYSNRLITLAVVLTIISCGKKTVVPEAEGTFEATETIVSSEATGKLIEFMVEEGQQVEAGRQVGLVDTIQLSLRRSQLLASMKAVETRRPDIRKQIAALEQQITTAATERRRLENLLKANAANRKQLDDLDAQVKVLEKQLEAQKSTLRKADQGTSGEYEALGFQVDQLDDQLKKCRIASPVSGTVLVKYAEPGEVTVPGKALFKVADLDTLYLRAYVTADQLSNLKLGQNVKVYADFSAENRREYSGLITWISAKSEFTPKTIQTRDERANLVYAVKVRVASDGYLKIGMYGGFKLGE